MWITGRRKELVSIARLTTLAAGKKALILDIGANCGAYTLPLAASCAPGSRIVAFEPNPRLANRLRQNIQLNRLQASVEVEEVALGAKRHEGSLNLDPDNLGRSSFHDVLSGSSISVPVYPLLDFLPQSIKQYEIFLIKIDIEGSEDEVLVPFLSTAPGELLPDAILMEITHRNLWRADLPRHLDERGYSRHFVGEENNTLFLLAQDRSL